MLAQRSRFQPDDTDSVFGRALYKVNSFLLNQFPLPDDMPKRNRSRFVEAIPTRDYNPDFASWELFSHASMSDAVYAAGLQDLSN